MDNIYKAVQLTIDSQNLALSKTPTHVYIANQYVDTNDTPLITAPFIIQKALENGTGVVDIVSSTIGSIYEVRLLCDAEVLISGYFYMPPMNVNFSELELYTSYPPRTPPVVNEFWQKTENFILEKTNTLLNFVQVFNSLSSMRLSLGYLEELATSKKSNLVSAINEIFKLVEPVSVDGFTDVLIAVSENVNQRQINDGLESIAQLLSIKNPRNGQRVYVKGYHAGLNKGGGTFIYNSTKSAINDGVVNFGGWVRASFMFVTSSMAGCKIDGVTDDTAALQRGIDYTASVNMPLYLDCGISLLDTLNFYDPTKLYATRGFNVFYFLSLKSNTRIIGTENSILKVANNQLFKRFDYIGDIHSGNFETWAMPGTKGFQVFAQVDKDMMLENVTLDGFTVDMNGYNNKIQPLNNFSNQSQCHAVYANKGNNIAVDNVTFKDAPGSQVICFNKEVANAKVRFNKFIDCGFLDGTNTHLDDHSTVFVMGENATVEDNRFIQSVQWTGKGGTPIEIHSKNGSVKRNYVEKYLSMGVIAAMQTDCDIEYKDNTGKSISALGLDCYCQNNHTFDLVVENNNVEIINAPLADGSPAKYAREFIVMYYFDHSPGTTNISLANNNVKSINNAALSIGERRANSFIHARLVDNMTLTNNKVSGFGAAINLGIQKTNAVVSVNSNNFVNCGLSDDFVTGNSVINYANDDLDNYGNTPAKIDFANNTYTNCKYASYLSLQKIVAQNILFPKKLNVMGDVTDKWFSTTIASIDIPDMSASYAFNYVCTTAVSTAKKLPDSGNLAKAQYGTIKVYAQVEQTYQKFTGVANWSYNSLKYDTTPPVSAEESPFGNKIGDRLNVVNVVGYSKPTGYIYNLDGDGMNPAWRKFGLTA